MRRFYQEARAAPAGEGFGVRLDARAARTPGKRELIVPTLPLAEAIAAEWAAQGPELAPASMHLTRIANSALDTVRDQRAAVAAEVARFAETDLLCYRADGPEELARRQAEAWDPLLDWARARLGADLAVTAGVVPLAQPAEAVAPFARAVDAFDPFRLAALHQATSRLGSLVLALALAEGRLDAGSAWSASIVDETWQAERWGAVAEAGARRADLAAEVAAAERFLRLCAAEAAP